MEKNTQDETVLAKIHTLRGNACFIRAMLMFELAMYWGEVPVVVAGKNYSGLTATWVEVVAGVKAKVFNNVFVGFSLRLNRLITNKTPSGFDNLYIPGFNRTYNGDFGVGFNYTVSYFVPLYKKKVLPAEKEKKEEKKPKK